LEYRIGYNFDMFDVLTVGTATRDVFLQSPLFKVVQDPKHLRKLGFPTGEAQCFALGAKIQVSRPVLTVGGGAANAAVTFARQGFKTGTVVGIGRDENGISALADLQSEKIKTFPIYDPTQMTGYSVILLSPAGERTILHYRGASRHVKGTETVWKKLRAKWVYISPGGIPLGAMLKIVKRFRQNGAKITINPSNEYLKLGAKRLTPLLSSLDMILLDREEAAYLTGVSYSDERGIFRAFDRLVKGLAVMTDGPRGVTVSDGKKIYRAGVFKEKKIADRTGAGDAFGSGFVAGLARSQVSVSGAYVFSEEDIKYAIRLGSANATSVVEQIGAQTGILHRREFRNKRWANLPVKIIKL
jgi:sugar/nucleoside kinase (ribokinase family)